MKTQINSEDNSELQALSHKFIHDIRSKLFCIEFSTKSLELYVNQLLELYEGEVTRLDIKEIPQSHLEIIRSSGPDIKSQLESINNKATQFLENIKLAIDNNDVHLKQVRNTSSLQQQPEAVRKILLVEDEEVHRDIAAHVLKPYNCILEFAENGQIAVEMFEHNTYDLVLMDIHMPILNGMEAIKVFRSLENRESQTPVIGISSIEPINPDEFFSAGFNKFLLKPLTLTRVEEALSELYPHREA